MIILYYSCNSTTSASNFVLLSVGFTLKSNVKIDFYDFSVTLKEYIDGIYVFCFSFSYLFIFISLKIL